MANIDEFKKKLEEIMGIKKEIATAPGASASGIALFQEEGEEDPDAAALDQLDQETQQDDSQGAEDTQDAPEAPEGDSGDAGDTPKDNAGGEENTDNTKPESTPEEQPQNNQNDNQKIQEMFKDSGQPEIDYSLSNENNVRLFKFKFTYAGVNVDTLMKNDEEKKAGLTRKELESRLSPEQLHYYQEKWKKLRAKFQEIPQREKNIAIHNANIMLLINDKEGNEIPLPENKRIEAYKKINTMMDKKFGPEWQDLPEALNFLKNIKVNFSEEKPVRTNLLSVNVLQEKDKVTGGALIPFNKIYVEVPQSVQGFLKTNQESQMYNGSSIFQALVSDFREADRTVGTMDAVIKGTQEKQDEQGGGGEGGGEGGDSGGGGGGGMGGDMGGDSGETPDLLDLGGDEGGEDTGGETGGDTGGDTAGDEIL